MIGSSVTKPPLQWSVDVHVFVCLSARSFVCCLIRCSSSPAAAATKGVPYISSLWSPPWNLWLQRGLTHGIRKYATFVLVYKFFLFSFLPSLNLVISVLISIWYHTRHENSYLILLISSSGCSGVLLQFHVVPWLSANVCKIRLFSFRQTSISKSSA